MDVRNVGDLSAILEELERHPRVTSCTLGDLTITLAAAQEAPGEPQQEGEPETLELPDGVLDPRKRIDAIYARQRKAAAPATDEPS